jgi:hypothetical protein
MQTARHAFRQHVVPHTPGPVGPVARKKARPYLLCQALRRCGCAGCAVVSARRRSRPARHRVPRTTIPPAKFPGASR